MLKAFLKDSAIYGIASMFTRGLQLLLVPLYTRVLAPSDYGSVDLMMVTAAIAMSVLTLEVNAGMVRAIGDVTEPAERRAYAGSALWLTAAGASVLGVIALFGGSLGDWVLGPGLETPFRVGLLAIAGQILFNLLTIQLRYDLRPRMYGLVSVAFTLISNATAVVLVVWGDTGVVGVFWGQVAGYLAAGAMAAVAARRGFARRFHPDKAREMLAYSVPLVFSVIGTHVAMLTDRVAIKGFLGLDEVGIYGIGARVASTVALLISAFASALYPLLFRHYKEPETPPQVARLFRVFLLMVLPILLGLSLFSREIVLVLAPPEYARAADVIAILSLAVTLAGMSLFTPGMELARRSRLLAVISIVVAFENVGLNLLLVPPMGAVGSATSTLISAATGFLASMIASQRLYPVPHHWRRLAVATVIAGAAAGAGLALTRADLGLWVGIMAKAALWTVASAALIPVLLERRDVGILRDRMRRTA